MELFSFYFVEGLNHILDIYGYDHILFVATLSSVYVFKNWKPLLGLITAFTIGHSLTLALATMELIVVSTALVEFLIPLTIFLTALYNLYSHFFVAEEQRRSFYLKYASTLFFGLIHGLGFSNFLRSMLSQEKSLFSPLLAFNVGLEVGQLFVVAVLLLVVTLATTFLALKVKHWVGFVSVCAAIVSVMLMIQRFPI